MQIEVRSHMDTDFLSVTVDDKVLTVPVAKCTLKSIAKACEKSGLKKVLLTESSLEKRIGENHHFLEIIDDFPNLHLAIVCKPELIDHQAKLFTAYAYSNDYFVRYFSEPEPAIDWLITTLDS